MIDEIWTFRTCNHTDEIKQEEFSAFTDETKFLLRLRAISSESWCSLRWYSACWSIPWSHGDFSGRGVPSPRMPAILHETIRVLILFWIVQRTGRDAIEYLLEWGNHATVAKNIVRMAMSILAFHEHEETERTMNDWNVTALATSLHQSCQHRD